MPRLPRRAGARSRAMSRWKTRRSSRCSAASTARCPRPESRARQTAERLGFTATVDPSLADLDCGAWSGSTLADLAARAPRDVEAWLSDPSAAPHGGESIAALVARVAGFLSRQAGESGSRAAVTHPAVIRAAIVHALDAPLSAFWKIDIAPLTKVRLHGAGGHGASARSSIAATERPSRFAPRLDPLPAFLAALPPSDDGDAHARR